VVNIEAPTVNVPESVVNVPAPIVNVGGTKRNDGHGRNVAVLDSILKQLKETPQFNLEEALAKFIKDDRIKVNVDRVGTGVGGVVTFPIVDAVAKGNYIAGLLATNGTRDLTSAKYMVCSTIHSTNTTVCTCCDN